MHKTSNSSCINKNGIFGLFNNDQADQSVNSPCIMAFDSSFRYIYLNKAAEKTIGKTFDAIQGLKLKDVFPDYNLTTMHKMEEAFKNMQVINFTSFSAAAKSYCDFWVYPSDEGLLIIFKIIKNIQ